MKARFTFSFILALLTSFHLIGQDHVERTLVKSFNLSGYNNAFIDVAPGSEIIVNEWNQEQMRVVMTVSVGNGSGQMLKSLVKVGRYNLDASDEDSTLRIFLPGLQREVKLRSGNKLVENINFEIFAPTNFLVKTRPNDVIAEKSDSSF